MLTPAPGSLDLSVVIPAYNELANLEPLLAELRAALDPLQIVYEIVIVDDGSTDGGDARLRDEAARDPRLSAVFLGRRRGQSAALVEGISRARGRVIATLDADLQNDPADLPRVLAALDHADVVSGVRATREDSWVRRASSAVANSVRRAVLGDSMRDIGCSLKAYRREALVHLPVYVGVHRYLPALCQFRGARVIEPPCCTDRAAPVSKYGVADRLPRPALRPGRRAVAQVSTDPPFPS
jgi:dolichol-phosphate mannosyltransferase